MYVHVVMYLSLTIYISVYICLSIIFIFYPFIPALPLGGEMDTLGTGDIDQEAEKDDTPIFEKHDNLLHGRSRG